jgi:hypothetical protein
VRQVDYTIADNAAALAIAANRFALAAMVVA